MNDSHAIEPLLQRPIYKFGMLLVFVILALFQVWMLAGESTRDVAKVGLVVVAMLAVNHVVLVFLRPPQRARVIPLQLTMVVGGLVYVVVMFWQSLRPT
ncbi:hypothetical protein [Gemmatimonas sp.]|uniref:hypothetical protein n=1 Tax=Gemmatimonas sp. TaxID=1962908 RepID=UPI00286DA26A|nr:hypothetical protein [Gemmatimonas sp.]